MSEKTFEVNGLEIRPGAVYKIVNKPDKSAPDGFIKEGTTKIPSYGISNQVGCRFVSNPVTGEGVYDTGLYVDSPCYSGMNREDVALKVALLKELIVDPYERSIGKIGELDHSNLEFWDNYSCTLTVDRAFRPEVPRDILDLFISVLSYELTPKTELKNPKFLKSQYVVEDVLKVRSYAEEKNDGFMTAVVEFMNLHNSHKALSFKVLEYAGLNGLNEDVSQSSLNSILFNWLTIDDSNPTKLMNVVKMARNPKTTNQVVLYSKLKALAVKGIVNNASGEYYYGDTYLGADLKSAAENINKKAELKDIKVEILDK